MKNIIFILAFFLFLMVSNEAAGQQCTYTITNNGNCDYQGEIHYMSNGVLMIQQIYIAVNGPVNQYNINNCNQVIWLRVFGVGGPNMASVGSGNPSSNVSCGSMTDEYVTWNSSMDAVINP